MVAFWEQDPRAPPSPAGMGGGGMEWPKLVYNEDVGVETMQGAEGGVYNRKAAVRVERLVEKVHNGSDVGPLDLLDDSCFASFGALNSGLVIAKRGVCSLNCGGKCEVCRQSGGG